MIFKKKKDLALVLSGGSARGLAHIGVLEVLEEHHIPINAIVGTSMGALIGGLYAAGTLKGFKKRVMKLSNSKIASIFLSNKIKKGNTDTRTIEPFLEKFTANKKMKELDIPFTAVATNLKTGKEVFLTKGDLLKNILASISIPGIFKPIRIGNKLLIDGGVIDPLPEKYGESIAEKVIAVNAMPSEVKYKEKGDFRDVIAEAVGIMTKELITLKASKGEKTIFIQLKTGGRDPFDFYHVNKLIEIGRKTTKKNIKQIIRMVQS